MGTQKFVAGVFGIMLVVGIVDNALQVALIVADLETKRKLCGFYQTGGKVWRGGSDASLPLFFLTSLYYSIR